MSIAFFSAYLTTLKRKGVYNSERIDVSDWLASVGNITRKVDSENFGIGLFNYGDITIDVVNFDGRFNSEIDPRSIFGYSRDLAKLEIEYTDENGNITNIFNGLLNEEATVSSENLLAVEKAGKIKLKFIALESVLNKVLATGGLVADGENFSTAIKSILNQPTITSVLNFDEAKINVGYDGIVDNASKLTSRPARDAIRDLLVVSNSVLLVDEFGDMVVKPRVENSNTPHKFYGAGDLIGRENISALKHNSGLSRCFNSIKINDTLRKSDKHINRYNLRAKEFKFEFITSWQTENDICQTILEEFWFPRDEIEIKTTFLRPEINLLDKAQILYKPLARPVNNQGVMPIYDTNKYGVARYPETLGSLYLQENIIWKVLEITHDLRKLLTTVKLRKIGNNEASAVI